MRRQRRLGSLLLVVTALSAALTYVGEATGAHADAPLIAKENPADPRTYDPYFGEQWGLGSSLGRFLGAVSRT